MSPEARWANGMRQPYLRSGCRLVQVTMPAKFYAVRNGRSTGIFNSWDDCKAQTNGHSGAQFKSFNSQQEAAAWMGGGGGGGGPPPDPDPRWLRRRRWLRRLQPEVRRPPALQRRCKQITHQAVDHTLVLQVRELERSGAQRRRRLSGAFPPDDVRLGIGTHAARHPAAAATARHPLLHAAPSTMHARARAQRSTYITTVMGKPSPAEVVARCIAAGDAVQVTKTISRRPGAYRVVRVLQCAAMRVALDFAL